MKAHRTDSVSLFFGLLFLFVAGAFLARRLIHVELPSLGWFVAGGLIIFGVLGVLAALTPRKRAEIPVVDQAPNSDD
ncbi:hypothetical protein Cs7R123_34030 [Catellatospora sp. TT07R-123]|uniref:hypothetical protein n=1 Tax=Catellatospora sp. TT07R-123 TaxID=2733863 RepID=UPI001B1A5D92|nr:hypothetical protein [Catellatospora sp. TT07R-123]GHJ46061.1 hypothetical protein Cs7R123_34030 [Catellatospora sp. TT07R-123]